MGKRVYELAKELSVEAKQVIQRLKDVGVTVKDHLHPLTKEEEEKARKLFEVARPGAVQIKWVEGGRVVRRRAGGEGPVTVGGPATPAAEPVAAPEPAPEPTPEPTPVVVQETTAPAVEETPAPEPVGTTPAPVAETVAATPAPVVTTPAPTPAPGTPHAAAAPAQATAQPQQQAQQRPGTAPAGQVPPAQKDLKSLAESPDRKGKVKKLVYDRQRDVISLRDIMIAPEDAEEHVEPQRPSNRRNKKAVQRRGRPQRTILTTPKEQKRVIRVEGESILVSELAAAMSVKANELIRKLMGMGVMAGMTVALDLDTATLVAAEFGFTLEKVGFDPIELLKEQPDTEESRQPRWPVVTIMGHVDHGKTTLLDRIRKARVAEGEAGGITQHIGAYQVHAEKGDIVFLDTPGHEAFTAMRARGAKVTDIVVLVVAADDGVMAQTKEAIAHARDAGVPIIVAINKIDKPEANIDRVRRELADEGIISEDWGGQNIFVEISAKQGLGIDHLMEMILLQSEVLDLKANPSKPGRGTVVEAQLDTRLGPVATILVQAGTVKVGDVVMAGYTHGKIRVMTDDVGKPAQMAGPSTAVRVAGLNSVPNAGDSFVVLPDEKMAREVAEWQVEQIKKARSAAGGNRVSLEDFYSLVQTGTVKELRVIVRADVNGSLAPLIDSVSKLKHPEIQLKIIHSAVGAIAESDVNLAIASSAVIVGFNISTDPKAQHLADIEKVDIRRYNVIYDVIDDLKKAMEGLLTPKQVARLAGKAEVRQVFSVSKVGKIAGCIVSFGHVLRNHEVHVVRGKDKLFEGKISSLKRFKDDVREVKQGLECGIAVDGFENLEPGDTLEFFEYDTVRETVSAG